MKEQTKALKYNRDSVNKSPTFLSPTMFTFPRKEFFFVNQLETIFVFFFKIFTHG